MIRCGIAGCGGIAQVHAQVLSALEGAEFVSCADIRFERAQTMAQTYGLKAYDDVETMLKNERLDVLHICTPHPLHTPIALLAARYGVHVLTEKPPAVNPAQWEQLSAIENVRVGVCFQNRFNPCVQAAKALLASGKAGKILGAKAFVTWHREPPYYTESDWRGRWDTEGGGALINQSIHTLDLLVYLLSRPVTSQETHMANHSLKGIIEVEDTVTSYIRFGDVSAIFYATNAYCTDSPVLVEIQCENVRIRLEGPELTLFWADGTRETPSFEESAALGKGYWGTGHTACIGEFYRCIRENAPFMNELQTTRETLHLMYRMYDSCKESLKA